MRSINVEELMDGELKIIAENEVIKNLLAGVYQDRVYVLMVAEKGGMSLLSNSDTFDRMREVAMEGTTLLLNGLPDDTIEATDPEAPAKPN